MAIKSLNLTYSLLGKEIGLVSKTGIYEPYEGKYGYGSDKIIPQDDPDGWFTSSHGIPYIEAERGNKISIGLFGPKGGMFIIYNHDKDIFKVFPQAVDDLYYTLDLKGSNFIQEFLNNRKIKQAANNFSESSILKKAIKELKNK